MKNVPPDSDTQAHSERLQILIRTEIERGDGQITFARYMDLALYAPGLGYYSAGACKFGEAGDFVTAPELSPLFSRCVARQCRQVLAGLGAGDILEVGAGTGALAAEVLRELEALDCLPGCYFILDLSAELRQRQRETLEQRAPHLLDRVRWLDRLPGSGFTGVVLANELLDAMPVHLFRMEEEGPQELYVGAEDERFVWRNGPLSDPRLGERVAAIIEEQGPLSPGYTSEINLAAEGWVRGLAEWLARGTVLIIDYGFPRREYYHHERSDGTLMCHHRHRAHPDPLILTGLQDITAHVDFTAVAEAAVEVGLAVAGYATQAYFLLGSGLMEMAGQSHPDDTRQHLALTQQIKKLTLPSEMGELFKVIALTRGIDLPLIGFSFQDQRGRL
ncbi:MAG: SAM-dependent methyltransferase [Gammaproteobacteria bacterium]|nr:SAM-dependent methyltransferase [Gammaproteobacteria bacterium]